MIPRMDVQELDMILLLHKRIRSLRELPPSTGALLSQARRAAYIAAFYWGTIISSKI